MTNANAANGASTHSIRVRYHGLLLVLLAGSVISVRAATTGTLVPAVYQVVLDANGDPISGAKICTYLAGTSTPVATYTTAAINVENANPVTADSAGRWVAFLAPGASYKFIFQDASGTPGVCDGVAFKTVDGIQAVPSNTVNLDITGVAGETLPQGNVVYLSDGTGGGVPGEWYKANATNAYSSSTAIAVGIVPVAIVAGSTGTVRVGGQATGFSVTTGLTYYIGGSGGLTTTPQSNLRVMGIADTTASLILVPGNRQSFFTGNVDVMGTAGEDLPAQRVAYLSDGSGAKTAGRWYLGDAANTYSSSAAVAIGMTSEAIATSGVGPIRVHGTPTGFSVTAGSTYYIGTSGALTASPSTNARQVGIANTTSSLVLSNYQKPSITGVAQKTSNFTTASGTLVDVTDLSVTITTLGGPVLVQYSGPLAISAGAQSAQLGLLYDSTDTNVLAVTSSTTNTPSSITYLVTGLSAGSHTFKVRAKSSDGVATVTVAAATANAVLVAMELKG